jgi:phage shock protein PspC (stress-responsive transcriptional regulator)
MTNDSTGYGPGTPPPAGSGPATGRPGAPGGDGFFGAVRRIGITRGEDRWIGGVASGVADRFGFDPLLVRGVFGLAVLMGFGLVLYGVAWALLPEPDGRIHLEQAIHGDWDGGLIGAGVLVLIGATSGGWWFSWGPFDSGWFPALAWSAALVALIIVAANARKDRRGPTSTPEGQAPMPDPTSPQPTPAAPRATAPVPPPAGSAPPRAPYGGAQVPPPPSAYSQGSPGTMPGAAPAWQQPRPQGSTGQPPRPPKPPKSPKPPRPRVPGPGSAVTGAVVGLILIGLAGLLIADRTGAYTGPVASVVVGAGVVLVGLAIILCGILGRRSGGLTALAIIGFVIAGPAVASDSDADWRFHRDGGSVAVGDRTFEVTSRSDAADGFTVGVGSAEIDLTDVPLRDDDTLVVPVQVGMGNVTVVVPDGVPVEATVRSGGGTVSWDLDDSSRTISGVGNNTTFRSEELTSGTTAQIELQVDLGLGDVTIEED